MYVHGPSELQYLQKNALALDLFNLMISLFQQEINQNSQSVFSEILKPDAEPFLVGIGVVFDELLYRRDEMLDLFCRRCIADV